MGNKEDWEEVQKGEDRRRNEEIDKYGLDFSNIKNKRKGVNKIHVLVYSFNIMQIVIIAIITIIIIGFLATYYENMNFMMANSKIEKEMLKRYNLEVTIFSKVKDFEKHNMTFKMRTQNSENIEFTAILKKNKIVDDYIARKHKYYFELWNNANKENFTINEFEANDMLTYETYIENFDNIEDAKNEIKDFAKFCGDNFVTEWKIYIKEGNKKIYPLRN